MKPIKEIQDFHSQKKTNNYKQKITKMKTLCIEETFNVEQVINT
jgi:hypothetical protein